MDVLAMIAIIIMGAIAFNFGIDRRSIVSAIFGTLLGSIAVAYIFCKILNGG